MPENRRDRIHRWYRPENYASWTEAFFRAQTEFLGRAPDKDPRSWKPEELASWADGCLAAEGELPLDAYLEKSQPLLSRRALGHQVPPPVPLSALWDGLGAFLNQGAGLFEMSPAASAAEWAVVGRMKKRVPWPEGDGFFTSGGTLANVTALLAARNHRFPEAWTRGVPPGAVLVAGADAHYSVSRSAGILGLGTEQVSKVPLDERRRMDPAALAATLDRLAHEGRPVIAVVATSGSTPVGAFDPLEPIGRECRKRGIWLHVDGAHGAAVLFSSAHRKKMQGIEQADSLVWDTHKMMHMPALSTAVLFRERDRSWKAFHQEAPYMFDPDGIDPRYDGAQRTFECTRRALAVPLWGTWAVAGEQLFEDLVDHLFELTTEFHRLLEEAPDFRPLHAPEGNIQCFAYEGGDEAKALRRKVLGKGRYYLTQTVLDGEPVLRVALMNPLVELSDLRGLLDEIRSAVQA